MWVDKFLELLNKLGIRILLYAIAFSFYIIYFFSSELGVELESLIKKEFSTFVFIFLTIYILFDIINYIYKRWKDGTVRRDENRSYKRILNEINNEGRIDLLQKLYLFPSYGNPYKKFVPEDFLNKFDQIIRIFSNTYIYDNKSVLSITSTNDSFNRGTIFQFNFDKNFYYYISKSKIFINHEIS